MSHGPFVTVGWVGRQVQVPAPAPAPDRYSSLVTVDIWSARGPYRESAKIGKAHGLYMALAAGRPAAIQQSSHFHVYAFTRILCMHTLLYIFIAQTPNVYATIHPMHSIRTRQ